MTEPKPSKEPKKERRLEKEIEIAAPIEETSLGFSAQENL
jgi:hypothetical protein